MNKMIKAAAQCATGLFAIPVLLVCEAVLASDTATQVGQPGLISLPNVTVVSATPEQARTAASKSAAAIAGVRAFKDKDTGRLRAATPEELEAIAAEAPAVAEVPAVVYRHSSGALIVELGESAMSYAVARMTGDGRIDRQCVTGPEAANKSTSAQVAPKEHNHAH